MKKILGMIAIVALCAATARAAPTGRSASLASLDAQGSLASEEGVAACEISICFTNTALVVLLDRARAAGDIGVIFDRTAIFMGDEDDGLLKGPRTYALDFCGQKTNLCVSTEVINSANAGKIDAALFISMTPATAQLALNHSPPLVSNTDSRGDSVS